MVPMIYLSGLIFPIENMPTLPDRRYGIPCVITGSSCAAFS
jgi:hypothetical protein